MAIAATIGGQDLARPTTQKGATWPAMPPVSAAQPIGEEPDAKNCGPVRDAERSDRRGSRAFPRPGPQTPLLAAGDGDLVEQCLTFERRKA
jgi:hypothetical protein